MTNSNSDIFKMDVKQARRCYLDLRYLLARGIDEDGSELPMRSERRREMEKRAQIAYSRWLEVRDPRPISQRTDACRAAEETKWPEH